MEDRTPWLVEVEYIKTEFEEVDENDIVQIVTQRVPIQKVVPITSKKDNLIELPVPFQNDAITITIGNRKGGAGKTSSSMMLAYCYAKMGLKTLYVDSDAQANATQTMAITHDAFHPDEPFQIKKSLMAAIQSGSLDEAIVNILPNLDCVPNYNDFEWFARWLYRKYPQDNWEEMDFVFDRLFDPIRKQYDLIIFDTPPSNVEIQRNVLVASDYVIISLQTQERSMTGAEEYIEQISDLKSMHDLDVQILGILPVLFNKAGTVDKAISDSAMEKYGKEIIFENRINHMERVKGFDFSGIVELDHHDVRTIKTYTNLALEILEKIYVVEGMDFKEERKDAHG